MAPRDLGWGLVGTRGYAATSCAPAIDDASGADLVAVLGRDPEGTARFGAEHGAAAETDLATFLATPGLDAVWVSSPTSLHYEQTMAALEAGKHVLLEKPLAIESKLAWELCATAKARGLVLATGYQARYVPGHIEMRRMIEDGELGEITVGRSFYGVDRSGPPPDWRLDPAMARWGALGDIGTHHVDLWRMLLGEVRDGTGITSHAGGYPVEDAAAAALLMESGASVSLAVSMRAPVHRTHVEVIGTRGTLVAVDTSPSGDGAVFHIPAGGEQRALEVEKKVSFVAQVETVTRVIRGESLPYATGDDGARNIEILEWLGP